MTQFQKALRQFLNRPTSLGYADIEKILLHLGFEKINAKGSHKKFKHLNIKYDLIIPVHNNNCKNFYKKMIAKIIKKHFI